MSNRRYLLAALGLLGLAGAASAQAPQPMKAFQQHNGSARSIFNPYPAIMPSPNNPLAFKQPAISPYLNLLRGGDPAVNYYLNVVPLLQAQNRAQEPTFSAPQIDPRLDQEFRDIAIRRSTSGNMASYMNFYGAYSLPNQRGYLPYTPPGLTRPPIGQ
ncbi:MAG TPA: hypothetical protein VFE62_30455 [Gemmataceae bacterium]|nr:hypothetical protein [Gemmataceae bacterium]